MLMTEPDFSFLATSSHCPSIKIWYELLFSDILCFLGKKYLKIMYVFWSPKMASHFKWYPSSDETVVPWNARYQFPSQSNKAEKMTPRIPPKNGSQFNPGQTIRLEFPAQGKFYYFLTCRVH